MRGEELFPCPGCPLPPTAANGDVAFKRGLIVCLARAASLHRSARLLAFIPLMLCFAASVRAADRQTVSRHLPESVANLQPVGRLNGAESLNLAIALPLRNQQDLAQLLQRLYDASSPDYRKYVTPQKFTEMFGPSEQDYQALIVFAQANHLTITGTHPNRALLDVRGTVADIEKAFGVTLRQYPHPTEARTFYAPDADPSLDLGVRVLSIRGLDNYTLPRPKNLRSVPSGRGTTPNGGSGPGGTYMGNDFRAAYIPGVSLSGSGQAVGLVEFEGYYQNDITNYEGQSGYANVTLTNVLIDGATGLPDGNALKVAEVSTDIELAIAMAPGLSQVMVYEVSPTSSYGDDMLMRMAEDNVAKQLSSSWNFAIDQGTEQTFQQFAAQGQSFFDASGDVGAYTRGVPSPDDDPNLTIVGGTSLTTSGSGGWVSETTWNMGGGVASSGGISGAYPIPYWQQTVNLTGAGGSATMRNIPDVALTASNIRVIYNNGSAGTFEGTSCAAPLWAGFMALVNQQAAMKGQPPAGFINPALYWIGQGSNYTACFHDITSGNNTNANSDNLFQAAPGYDLCTGWGTPAGSNLITALSAPEPLQLLSNAGFAFNGLAGGPFGPAADFTLTNIGGQSLTWALTNLPTWLTMVPTNGLLVPSSVASVSVNANATANSLPVGNYTNGILILDATDGFALYCQFTLQVQQTLVQNGGFETGNFSGWTESGNTSGIAVTKASQYVHSGQWGARLGPSGSLGYLSQTVPTAAGQAYLLSLWLDSPDGKTPNEFSVAWNGTLLFDQIDLGKIGWTNLQFTVTATGQGSILQLGFRDDPSFLGLDDVSLVPIQTQTLVATNVAVQRGTNSGAKVRVATLLAGSSDPIHCVLVSAGPASTNGGTVATNANGNWIFYTPPMGPAASDAFPYVITNNAGLQATGWLSVTVPVDLAQSQNIVAAEDLGQGASLISFQGIPGRTYTIQYTESLQTPVWQTLGTSTADATGAFAFTDAPGSGSPPRFYRSTCP